jgi:hypothetical protein
MLRGGGEEIAYDTVDRHELAEAAKARAQVGAVSIGPFDSHELAELAKLRVNVEAGSGLTLGEWHTNPDFAVEQRWVGESGATLEEVEAVGALAIVPVTPVSYESNVALREVGALAIVPVTPVSYESNVALREVGALAIVPFTPVSYESHAALREAGALAIVPVTPVSYESNVALREAGAPFEASSDTFETTYEAASGLSMGARHTDPSFAVGIRYVGVSDMTLEEFELPG